jgi:hypothetical protein
MGSITLPTLDLDDYQFKIQTSDVKALIPRGSYPLQITFDCTVSFITAEKRLDKEDDDGRLTHVQPITGKIGIYMEKRE